jgi:succinyl-CoA synthetase beta subunit
MKIHEYQAKAILKKYGVAVLVANGDQPSRQKQLPRAYSRLVHPA